MSKWTLIRKTKATPICGFQNLREGCFEMKVDHFENQGATRFDFQICKVKLQVQIFAEQPSHGLRKRGGAHGQIL